MFGDTNNAIITTKSTRTFHKTLLDWIRIEKLFSAPHVQIYTFFISRIPFYINYFLIHLLNTCFQSSLHFYNVQDK